MENGGRSAESGGSEWEFQKKKKKKEKKRKEKEAVFFCLMNRSGRLEKKSNRTARRVDCANGSRRGIGLRVAIRFDSIPLERVGDAGLGRRGAVSNVVAAAAAAAADRISDEGFMSRPKI